MALLADSQHVFSMCLSDLHRSFYLSPILSCGGIVIEQNLLVCNSKKKFPVMASFYFNCSVREKNLDAQPILPILLKY